MNKKREKYLIFHVEGGMGKSVLSTAVIRALKKGYPDRKIIIVTAWDAPIFYNPAVYRFYTINQFQYFYDTYIKDQDVKIFRHEVYHHESHILEQKHITESWCDMIGVKYDGYKPEIYLNPRELEIAKDKIKPTNKPIMLIQSHGGSAQQYSKKSWFRDMPIELAQQLVNHYKSKYRILHIRTNDQLPLQGVEQLTLPLRELYAVFPLSSKRIFIDSFASHIAAALDLQSTVLWVGNKPKIYGYKEHINITCDLEYKREFTKFNYLEKHRIDGQIQEFPYDTINMFDINEIIKAVDSQK